MSRIHRLSTLLHRCNIVYNTMQQLHVHDFKMQQFVYIVHCILQRPSQRILWQQQLTLLNHVKKNNNKKLYAQKHIVQYEM